MALKPKQCWYCAHFFSSGIANQGECRRHAPVGLDSNMINTFNGDNTKIFAQVYDATGEWCGEFQPSPVAVPVPS